MLKQDFLDAAFTEIERGLRGFDISTRCSEVEKEKLIILLPFTGDVAAVEFVNRIKEKIEDIFGEEVEGKIKAEYLPLKMILSRHLQKLKSCDHGRKNYACFNPA